MNANRQLINLAGVLLVVVLLVTGVALVAMPLYAQSGSTDLQTVTVAQQNSLYEQQIAELTAAAEGIDAIDADLSALRSEIAADAQLDDVHRLIATAAATGDVHVESVTIDEAATFVPRNAASEQAGAEAAASSAEAPVQDGAEDAADGADETADDTAVDTAPTGDEELGPQQQILVTVTVDLATPFVSPPKDSGSDKIDFDPAELNRQSRAAAAFVDALRAGPRLVSPVEIELIDGKLTVAALTYYRVEDPS